MNLKLRDSPDFDGVFRTKILFLKSKIFGGYVL